MIFRLLLLLAPAYLLINCHHRTTDDNVPSATLFFGKAESMDLEIYLNKGEEYSGTVWLSGNSYPFTIYPNDNGSLPGSLHIRASELNATVYITGTLENHRLEGELTVESDDTSRSYSLAAVKDRDYPFQYVWESRKDSLAGSEGPWFEDSREINWADESSKVPSAYNNLIAGLSGLSSLNLREQLRRKMDSSYREWKHQNDSAQDFRINYENLTRVSVFCQSAETITFSAFDYEYSGGAHGMYYTRLKTAGKRDGRPIRLEDLMTNEEIGRLPMLLEEEARRRFDAENNLSLKENGFFVDTILPSKNFYVRDNGVGFYFSLYELLPYATGEVVLFIPFDRLRPTGKTE